MNGTAYVTRAPWPIMYEKNDGRISCASSGSGMLGLMNVLAIERRRHNIDVNCLTLPAATRMTTSIPGRPGIDVDNPPAESAS
jgi:hypothetical protein